MAANNVAFLNVARVNGIMEGLQDTRVVPQQLLWLNRTTTVPATDDEITSRYFGQVLAADLIADDARAAVYSQGRFQFESVKIPNLKIGVGVNQSMLNTLNKLSRGVGAPEDGGIFTRYESNTMDNLLLGIRQRQEALIVAMLCDGLSYDRLGIRLDGVTWGMFADLKVTVGTTWDTAGSATPVNDILNVAFLARVRYGIVYDTVTMSTQAFRYMIATTEFQNKVRQYIAPNVSFANIPQQSDLRQQLQLAGNVLGMTIELYDARYWTQNESGIIFQQPYQPVTKVILTSKSDFNDPMAWDFANAVVTETIVTSSGVGTSVIGGNFRQPQAGPIAYATPTNVDLNSPGITYWGVARGFPRKKRLQSSAVLTVGTFSDSIPVGVPIPQ